MKVLIAKIKTTVIPLMGHNLNNILEAGVLSQAELNGCHVTPVLTYTILTSNLSLISFKPSLLILISGAK